MSEAVAQLGIVGLALMILLQAVQVAKPMVQEWLRTRRTANSDRPGAVDQHTIEREVRDQNAAAKVSELHTAMGVRSNGNSWMQDVLQQLTANDEKQTQILDEIHREQKAQREETRRVRRALRGDKDSGQDLETPK
jgi:hypothetical protein